LIMAGGATALRTGTQASPGMAAKVAMAASPGMVVASAGMAAASAGMVAAAGTAAAEATVES